MDAPVPTPGRRFLACAIGAGLGVLFWFGFGVVQDRLPVAVRLLIAAPILTFGPGASAAVSLLSSRSWFTRIVFALSIGVALAPMLAHALGAAGLLALLPYICAGLSGGVVACWLTGPAPPAGDRGTRWAALALVVIALTMGTVAFANRLSTSRGAVAISGDYDSHDLSYYAEIAAEVSHTLPPASPFYAGRLLNHAFYPHVLLGMVHRFGGVPLLDLYFHYAWPAFLVLAMLVCFVCFESCSSTRAAFFSALLFGAGSNLAYLAAWFLKPAVWDDIVWSHNFQGAGAEVLFYGNWTPALIAMFAGFYAIHAACREGRVGWAVLAGATLATTILSKPWIFASVMSALALVAVFHWRNAKVRQALLIVLASGAVAAAPLLYRTIALFEDSQVTFRQAFCSIPLVMADRIGLREWFLALAGSLGLSGEAQRTTAGVFALPIFLLGTLGFRLIAMPALWRALRHPSRVEPVWSVLGWTAVAAFVASSIIVSDPYHEITQVHQFVLFALAGFVGLAVGEWKRPAVRSLVTGLVVLIAVPCTVHYLSMKWTDGPRVLVEASPAEVAIASMLHATDPEGTLLLHDRPDDATLVGILSERRSVLAWASYVRGSEERRNEVESFFAGPDSATAMAVLRRYRPTHVIDNEARDRMNQDVRDRLELVMRREGVALYRVPAALVQ